VTPDSQLQAEGPAFPLTLRVLATVLVLGLVVVGVQAVAKLGWAAMVGPSGPDRTLWLLIAGAVVVVGTGYVSIMTSRTCFDGMRLHQSWLWRKEVALADISQLKLIRIPGLDWIFVPRLVVRARGQALPVTFQLGDPRLVALSRKLAYGE
jgi:hypothetical protein